MDGWSWLSFADEQSSEATNPEVQVPNIRQYRQISIVAIVEKQYCDCDNIILLPSASVT